MLFVPNVFVYFIDFFSHISSVIAMVNNRFYADIIGALTLSITFLFGIVIHLARLTCLYL